MGEDECDLTLGELHERNRESTRPVSVRLPEPLLSEVDDLRRASEFDTRSELVRAVLRAAVDRPGAFDLPETDADRDEPSVARRPQLSARGYDRG